LQPGGHRFEPGILHHPSLAIHAKDAHRSLGEGGPQSAATSFGWQANVHRSAKREGGPEGCAHRSLGEGGRQARDNELRMASRTVARTTKVDNASNLSKMESCGFRAADFFNDL
jgi:hypothetical protein